jgi:hypothetical protein
LHVFGRSAKADAFGLSFLVMSAKVSAVGLRLRHNRLTRGSMLEVSRDAAAAGEEQLVSCAAEQSKYWCCRRRFHICLSFARLSLAWLFALGRVLT